ncbi:MAG: nicotinate-nucleotide adenylyltransferase [Lachnospiraceae bacterium]|nr:nicotinate-nucleotide adenylyltransferase [Lachnospiraceae bacterium]
MKIGIMGGTFNPVHLGHIAMAKCALEQYHLDRIMFLPSGDPPHKKGAKILSAKDRVALLEKAILDFPQGYIDTMEIEREGYSYTVETMEELTALHPEVDYYYIIGGDSLAQFSTWRRPEDLAKLCTFLVAPREGMEEEEFYATLESMRHRYQATMYPLAMELIPVSSTKIREQIADLMEYMDPKVLSYIVEQKLYQSEEE